MPFAEMTVQNRANALSWARSHAWGRDAIMSEDGVLSGVSVLEDAPRRRCLNFTSLHDLARWAGY